MALELKIESGAFSLLAKVSRFLNKQGIRAYLIGGFVRDILLGRETADIDIAVGAEALTVATKVAEAIGGKYVLLDEINQIGRVVPVCESSARGKWEIDFSTLRGSIEEDLAQRDFTIDAMAIELNKLIFAEIAKEGKMPLMLLEIIDPFGGQADLRRKVVRAVSETAFLMDAARLLRGVRLAAELGFIIDGETERLIHRYRQLVSGVAGERIREELLKLLALPYAGKFFTYLNKLSLLTAIVPELAQMRGVEQPVIHFWDVLDHSLQTVSAVEFLLRQGDWQYAQKELLEVVPWSTRLAQHFNQEVSYGSNRRSLLKLAALLHDIAKPQTKIIDESGRVRFLGHAKEGAEAVANILQRLRFSAKEIKLVETMVRHHLRPTQMSQEELPTHRAIYRYFRDTEDAGIDILFLSLADHLATRGKNLDLAEWQRHVQTVEYILTRRFEEEGLTVPRKLVDGNDLINIFGLSPGPQIGRILEALREAQAAGEVTTREQALVYVKDWLASPSNNKLGNERWVEEIP